MKPIRFIAPAVLIAAVLAGLAGGLFLGKGMPPVAEVYPQWNIKALDNGEAWQTYGNSGFTFRAPASIFWKVGEESLQIQKTTCAEVNRLRALKEIVRICYGDRVCVNETSQGAAGSSYVTYDISVKDGASCGAAVFTIRYTNGDCAAYDTPLREACAAYQDHLRAETLPAIYSTFQFN